jgi:exonuclease SbcC
LAEIRSRDQRATSIRESLSRLAVSLGREQLRDGEGFAAGLERLESWLHAEEARLTERDLRKRSAYSTLEKLEKLSDGTLQVSEAIQRNERRRGPLVTALAKADERRNLAKRMADAARDARTDIVRRVFNQSLNAVWRELFIRLAPDEPFVPAFALPQDGPVVAALETIHRQGDRGGSPGAMLGSWNLNTAALTLFLALHLAAESRLPFLVP